MSLALNESKAISPHSNLKTTSTHAKQPIENHGNLPMISPIDLKDSSNDEAKLPAFAVFADCLQE